MHISTKNSHTYLFALLTLAALVACLLLFQARAVTGSMVHLPGRVETQAPVARAEVPALATPQVAAPVEVAPAAQVARQNTGLSAADHHFFTVGAKIGVQENELSTRALTHLTRPEVREYADLVVDEYTVINAEWKELAARKNLAFPEPEELPSNRRWKRGEFLDQRYLDIMAEGNREVLASFEQAAGSDDAEIAAFARKTLPTLRKHLGMVQGLQEARK